MLLNFKVTIYLSIYLNKLSNKQKLDFYAKYNQYILGKKNMIYIMFFLYI